MTEPDPAPTASTRHAVPRPLLHDLRTPIGHIVGYSELLMEEVAEAGWDDFLPHLEKIRAAGYQLLALLDSNFESDGAV